MDRSDHERDADVLQAQVYRAMEPADRLRQAVKLAHEMRSLMDAGPRAQHPDWTDEQRRRVIAERVLYARTG